MSDYMRPRRGGLTLVELLVVIAMVGVLAALLMPVLITAHAAPESSACISNLKQLYAACSMYASDNNGYLPPYQNQMNIRVNAGEGRPFYKVPDKGDELVRSLASYMKTADVWFCPSDYLARSDSTEGALRHRFSSYKIDFYLGAYEVGGVVSFEGAIRNVDGSENTARPFLRDSLWEYFKNRPKPLYSHNGSFNFMFFDGHVESYPWEGGPW
jgi:prepilin-type processing-associated H-X9-DG protein/prepilin-type N-terminal cleavage/methylation domain-containing protein